MDRLLTSPMMADLRLPADTQAILLLCGSFSERSRRSVSPLSLGEYNALARWLHSRNLRPADLIEPHGRERLQHFDGDGITLERLQRLLERGFELGMAVEEWERQGIWVISRADRAYPRKLKRRLHDAAPPLLYGVGDASLLDRQALGLVGSRDAGDPALDLTREVAERCAAEELAIVSGGGRGVDQEAAFGALEAGGTVLAVLAEGVAKAAVAKKYRSYIAAGQLTLVSTFFPKARWTAGNAMGRNRYVYAFSDWTLVVSAGTKGGTWHGARENLKHGWAPMLVCRAADVPEGNARLIEMGAVPFEPEAQRQSPRLLDYLRRLAEHPAVTSGATEREQ